LRTSSGSLRYVGRNPARRIAREQLGCMKPAAKIISRLSFIILNLATIGTDRMAISFGA
jgi:hypothetical protein